MAEPPQRSDVNSQCKKAACRLADFIAKHASIIGEQSIAALSNRGLGLWACMGVGHLRVSRNSLRPGGTTHYFTQGVPRGT